MARAEDNPCLDGHPNPRPAGADFRAFGSGPVPLRVCGHLESSGAGETAAQSFLANKPLASVFSSLAFSPAVDCHPLQIRIDSGKDTGKQPGGLLVFYDNGWRGRTLCRVDIARHDQAPKDAKTLGNVPGLSLFDIMVGRSGLVRTLEMGNVTDSGVTPRASPPAGMGTDRPVELCQLRGP